MSKVERIDEVSSTLGEYRERAARLGQDSSDAAGWLELARWARDHDYHQGEKKAALAAARLDPDLAGLPPLMAALDYELDDQAREWVPFADAMRRRGLVEDRAEWITPDEKRERSQARVEEVTEQPRSRADDHLDKALDILAEAVRQPDAPATTVIVQPGGYGGGYLPGGYFPGFVGGGIDGGFIDPGVGGPDFPGVIIRNDIDLAWDAMAKRQPASFIPLAPRYTPRHLHPVTHRFTR
jgi:hypothetical protein